MKTRLRILGILLLGLFAISMAGCERTEDPPSARLIVEPPSHVEQLAGKYELIRLEHIVDGRTDSVNEPPVVEGSLTLVRGGSLHMFIELSGTVGDIRSDSWLATGTTINIDNSEYFLYTLEGEILTIPYNSRTEYSLKSTWQKK